MAFSIDQLNPIEAREARTAAEAQANELNRLRNAVRDLTIALHTSNQRGDLLQQLLHRASASLEVCSMERRTAELKLCKEKADLEILVKILIDQGDDSAEEGGKARIDALTQIANRRRFDEVLSHEWGCHLQLQQPLSLVVCDVDHFKLYNDHYGHQTGDECLKAVATTIGSCLRGEDLVARYGGEEFAIILPRTDLKVALQIAERVRSAVSAAAFAHATSLVCGHVTLSIGVACTIPPFQGKGDACALIEEADRFLYLAKRGGRNRVAHDEENSRT